MGHVWRRLINLRMWQFCREREYIKTIKETGGSGPLSHGSHYTNTELSVQLDKKRRKGNCGGFHTDRQTDTEVVLLHSCRETCLGQRGTEGLENQAPLCRAWTESCLALEALCTHERTHWKDVRFRWEEEANRPKRKEKQDLYGENTQIWASRHSRYTNVGLATQLFIQMFKQMFWSQS